MLGRYIFCIFGDKRIEMESLRIEILNPKVKRLLKDLVDLDLIRINKGEIKSEFIELLKKLRASSDTAPTLEEITKEVEKARKSRYE